MDKELIIATIRALLCDTFCVTEALTYSHQRTSLFLEPFCLDAISMTYLFLLLQESCHVVLAYDAFSDYEFSSIDSIAELILECKKTNGVAVSLSPIQS